MEQRKYKILNLRAHGRAPLRTKIILPILLLFFFAVSGEAQTSEIKQRIVSLSPAITEIVYALDGEAQLAGVTDYCDFPEAAKQKPKVGGFINPNLEAILSLNPDIVLISRNGTDQVFEERLRAAGVPTRVFSFYHFSEILDAFRQTGAVLGKQSKAEILATSLSEKISFYKKACAAAKKKRVLLVRWHNPLSVAGVGSLEEEIIQILGGENVVTEGKSRYPVYTLEAAVSLDPEIVVDLSSYETPTSSQKEELEKFWAAWPEVPAAKNGHLYFIRTDVHSIPGPRTAEFLLAMAFILHPEKFSEDGGLVEKIHP